MTNFINPFKLLAIFVRVYGRKNGNFFPKFRQILNFPFSFPARSLARENFPAATTRRNDSVAKSPLNKQFDISFMAFGGKNAEKDESKRGKKKRAEDWKRKE